MGGWEEETGGRGGEAGGEEGLDDMGGKACLVGGWVGGWKRWVSGWVEGRYLLQPGFERLLFGLRGGGRRRKTRRRRRRRGSFVPLPLDGYRRPVWEGGWVGGWVKRKG